MQIDEQLRSSIVQAIRLAQIEIHWKPDKGVEHLERRIKLAQLPETTGYAIPV